MQWVLCDCSIRVTVVLGVRQPWLLARKFATVRFPCQKGAWQMISFVLRHNNEAEGMAATRLYILSMAHFNNLFAAS